MIFLFLLMLLFSFLIFCTLFVLKNRSIKENLKLILLCTIFTSFLGFLIIFGLYMYYGNKVPEGTTIVTSEELVNPK